MGYKAQYGPRIAQWKTIRSPGSGTISLINQTVMVWRIALCAGMWCMRSVISRHIRIFDCL